MPKIENILAFFDFRRILLTPPYFAVTLQWKRDKPAGTSPPVRSLTSLEKSFVREISRVQSCDVLSFL